MNFESEHITTGYKKLKRLVYYDKTDLHLRHRLAEFECHPSFDRRLGRVRDIMNSANPFREPLFRKWLNEISFRVVPKSIEANNSHDGDSSKMDGKFISNVTSASSYQVTKVNYFFDGPIELHLVAVLWIMFEGRFLDNQLGDECYGARLEDSLGNPNDRSAGLFRKYHELYARWRDTGIRKAKELLTEERTNVCILGLDLQEFYYRIHLDYRSIAHSVYEGSLEEPDMLESDSGPSKLLRCVQRISAKYREKINPFLKDTHENIPPPDAGLPIGLCSSQVLANWCLRGFDQTVKTIVRPAYYGRYVDDILLVLPVLENPPSEGHPVATFIDRALVKTGLLKEPKNNTYELVGCSGLFLQREKCILQYFDAKHSIAGLEKFQKKLEENASDFALMPVDEADNSLEDVAYELLYEGSVNKFRSVTGMAENRFELAKHLARQTILHLFTDDPPDSKISLDLQKFFKGRRAIEFHDLWERVLTFFLIANDQNAAKAFSKHLRSEMKRVRHSKRPITELLTNYLEAHLAFCTDMSSALSDPILPSEERNRIPAGYVFRQANLIRHHFVRLPLLNYTTYTGSLTTRRVENEVKADHKKLELSPRYVNFDECLMLVNSGYVRLNRQNAFQRACRIFEAVNGIEVEGIEWEEVSHE